MTRNEAHQIVLDGVRDCFAKARLLFPTFTTPDPTVDFAKRGFTCGGAALGSRRLSLNADWAAADPVAYVQLVVAHEVAHIVCAATGLGSGHNRGWKRVCIMLGGHPESRISHPAFDVPKARRTVRHLYRMPSGAEVWLTGIMHQRIQSGTVRKLLISTRERIAPTCYTSQQKFE